MTYIQKFEELRKNFVPKGNKYIKAEKELSSILGLGDSTELSEFMDAKKEFEEADKNFYTFLLHIKEKNITLEEEFNE